MSIRKSFDIEEMVRVASEVNTDFKETIDDLIYGLSKCKNEMNKTELTSLSDMIKDSDSSLDLNSKASISNMIKQPAVLKSAKVKNAFVVVGVLGSGVGCFNEIVTLVQYLVTLVQYLVQYFTAK